MRSLRARGCTHVNQLTYPHGEDYAYRLSRRRTGQIILVLSRRRRVNPPVSGVHFREEIGHARAGQVLRGPLNPPIPWRTLGFRVVPPRARAAHVKMGGVCFRDRHHVLC